MELFNAEKKPLRKKDTEAFYLDENKKLVRVPGMFDTSDDVFEFIKLCVHRSLPGVPEKTLREVWKEAEEKTPIIIDALEQIKRENESAGDFFKVRAYARAIKQLERIKVPILSGEQALKIEGIGKGIASHIEEIIKSGGLKSLEEREAGRIERQKVLETFMKIWGVGAKVAGEWYQKGYRNLEDLKDEKLTAQQKVGIEYFEDIQEKIPRQEVQRFFDAVVKSIGDQVEKMDIVGSYRRGASESGDIDLLVFVNGQPNKKLLSSLVKKLEGDRLVVESPVLGAQKFMGIAMAPKGDRGRRLDITLFNIKDRGAALLHATGPQAFNVQLREQASQMGYKLNEHGLYKLSITDDEDEKIVTKTEQDIFEVLGAPYVEPEDRF